MPEARTPFVSPSEKRAARDAARKRSRIRDRAIVNAMRAGWADEDADEYNWLAEAASVPPGPEAAMSRLYGVATRAIGELAEATHADPDVILKRLLG